MFEQMILLEETQTIFKCYKFLSEGRVKTSYSLKFLLPEEFIFLPKWDKDIEHFMALTFVHGIKYSNLKRIKES